MSIIIHDIKIKSLIRQLQSEEKFNDALYNEILELVSEFIYNFPRIKYHKSKDICSEFYLYVLEYLPNVCLKFNTKGKASFQTWFSVVVFNMWRNYVGSAKFSEEEYKEQATINNLEEIDRYEILRKTVVNYSNIVEDENFFNNNNSEENSASMYIDSVEVKSLEKCFKKMPKKVRVVVKAHFFELFTSNDIEEAVEAFQLDFMLTLRKYERLVSKTRKQYKLISDTIDELNNNSYEINKFQNKIKKLKSHTNKNFSEIDKYKNKIKKLNKKKYEIVDKLKSMYIKLTPKEIADFFNTNANSISNLLHRGRNYIKDFFQMDENKEKSNKDKLDG